MLWWQWLVYCALPAMATTLLLVGAFGPRVLALAVAAAVLVPFALLGAVPQWPWLLLQRTASGEEWLPWLVAIAGLGGTLHDLRVWPAALGGPPAVVLSVAAPWLLLGPQRLHWSEGAAAVQLGAVTALLALVWLAQRSAARSGAAKGVLLTMVLCLAADSVVLWLAGATAALATTTAAALAGAAALALAHWRSPFAFGEGCWLVLAMVHVAALTLGHHQEALPRWSMLLACLSPAPLWLLAAAPAGEPSAFGPPRRLAAAIAMAAMFAATAVALLRR